MTSWMRNQWANWYNSVVAPIAATRNTLAKRLQTIRETASILYDRMMGNIEYGEKRLKGSVEKEAREEEEGNYSLRRRAERRQQQSNCNR